MTIFPIKQALARSGRTMIEAVSSGLQSLVRIVSVGVVSISLAACAPTAEPTVEPSMEPPEIGINVPAPAMLVFSKTAGWRHNNGIAGADLFLAELAKEKGFSFFTTANAAVFNAEDLDRFEVIVFNNVTGAALSADERAAFEQWMISGGAWLGLHGSGVFSLAGGAW